MKIEKDSIERTKFEGMVRYNRISGMRCIALYKGRWVDADMKNKDGVIYFFFVGSNTNCLMSECIESIRIPSNIKDRLFNTQKIVSAAHRHQATGEIIMCIRHFDSFVYNQLEHMSKADRIGWSVSEQGFVDNFGGFLSRTEAWHVALKAKQIIRDCGGDTADGGTLYSENLY